MNLPALTSLSSSNLADIAAYITSVASAVSANYQGLWWVPAAAENGWGINFAHQGDQIFATWYTYDSTGKPWWMSMLTSRTSPTSNVYSGPVYVDVGPAFNAFTGTGTPTQVGIGTLTFTDRDNGVLAYGVTAGGGNVQQVKQIQRFQLNTQTAPPVCTYGAATAANLTGASNYQDLWWVPGGTESGWGINFAHQGTQLFATWYTYDKTAANPPVDVGSATITFTNGNTASLNYTTSGAAGLPAVTQTKALTRFLFGPGAATICR